MNILQVDQIVKHYGYIKALNGVSFNVPQGSVFGILGPNGSGKTTLLGIITDVLKATDGSFTLFNEAPTAETRRRIGTLLETPNFYHYLSAVENLKIAAAIKQRGAEDIDRVLELLNLAHRKNSPFGTYSLGMKQRLAIASALLGDPDVLILDEPTNGLDPEGIAEIRSLIRTLASRGKTIIMASHMLDEVEKVCTHVAILKTGHLIASGDVDSILKTEDMYELQSADPRLLLEFVNKLNGLQSAEIEEGMVVARFPENLMKPEDLNKNCFEQGIVLSHIRKRKLSLEEKFLILTNK